MQLSLDKVPKLTENKVAVLIFLLISTIYLFPAFLGKVDNPVDIRDAEIYPWAYHAVDKKLKIYNLWEKYSDGSSTFDLNIKNQTENSALFNIKLNEDILNKTGKATNVLYYFVFDFKVISKGPQQINLKADLIDKSTNSIYRLPLETPPLVRAQGDNINWQKGFLSLKHFLQDFKSIEYLNDYILQFKVENENEKGSTLIHLKNLKLVCEDYSAAQKVKNPINDDLIQWFTPARQYFATSLKKGNIPFWDNSILTGYEFLAEPQLGYFHPVYIFFYSLFDHFTAHLLITFGFLILSGIAAFSLCRYWGFSFEVSLFTSVVYMFHPFNATWMSFEHMLMNSATLPFLLIFYQKNLSNKRLLNKEIIYSAFLLGLIFLSGHLQIVYYTVLFFFLFSGFFFLVDLFRKKQNYIKHIFSILFVFSFSILISSIVLIPFFPNFLNSYRVAIPEEMIRSSSIPLDTFKSLIYPFYRKNFSQEYVYFGLLPFLLSIFSIVTFVVDKKSQLCLLTIFFYLTLIFSILVFTGSPFFFFARNFLPGFKQLQHYRFLEIYSYCVPFICGIGFQMLWSSFLANKKILKQVVFILAILYTSYDLMLHSSYFVTWSERGDYKPIHKGGILEFLKYKQKESMEPFRVTPIIPRKLGETRFGIHLAAPNTLMPYDIEEISGYSSFVNKDFYALLLYLNTKDSSQLYTNEIVKVYENINIPYPISNYKSKILDLLNVKYFIVPPQFKLLSSDVREVFSSECVVYENLDFLPRAFVVPLYKTISSNKETIVELDNNKFDPTREVILMMTPGVILDEVKDLNMLGYPSPLAQDDISFLNYHANTIKLKVDTNRAGFLVLGHNLNNNWKVKVNGKKREHLQANLVQRAVYLPKAGKYIVEFYYFPKLYLIGLASTVLATIFLVFLMVFLINLEKSGSKKDFQIEGEEKEKKLISV